MGKKEEMARDYEEMGLQLRSYPFPFAFSFLQSDCFRNAYKEDPEGVKWEQGLT